MTAKFQKTDRKWLSIAAFACLLLLGACMGSGTSFLQDTGLEAPLPAVEPVGAAIDPSVQLSQTPESVIPSSAPSSTDDPLYADLPTGPSDTGTFPDFTNEPEPRIVSDPGQDVEALTNQMIALADDHEAGRISTAAYQKRLAYLRALAKNHSTDMLAQIGEPAN